MSGSRRLQQKDQTLLMGYPPRPLRQASLGAKAEARPSEQSAGIIADFSGVYFRWQIRSILTLHHLDQQRSLS